MERPLTPELLAVWERGLTCSPVERYLLLLKAAHPEQSWAALSRKSLGQRNAALLTLREALFGPTLISLVICPACRERLEFSFQTTMLQTTMLQTTTPRQETETDVPPSLSLSIAGYDIQYRLPTSHDLLTLPDMAARGDLLQHCLEKVTQDGTGVDPRQLPATVIEAVEMSMARLDPLADVQIDLQCPHCQHAWQAGFDIGAFLWQEIDAWARRLLQEVHLLASAYGWGEADILSMSATRRQLYLKMIYG